MSHLNLGWTINLKSEVGDKELYWEVYAGYYGVPHPTFSLSISHERFTLQPKTETFITFDEERDTILSKRGWFYNTEYCSNDASYADSIRCYKKCLLEFYKGNHNF